MKPRILVVEDNLLNRELLCDWLDAEGYEVTAATDLKTGFEAVEKEPPAGARLAHSRLGETDAESKGGHA